MNHKHKQNQRIAETWENNDIHRTNGTTNTMSNHWAEDLSHIHWACWGEQHRDQPRQASGPLDVTGHESNPLQARAHRAIPPNLRGTGELK